MYVFIGANRFFSVQLVVKFMKDIIIPTQNTHHANLNRVCKL